MSNQQPDAVRAMVERLDETPFSYLMEALRGSIHWGDICEDIVAQAIENGDVREGEAVDDLDAERIVDLLADGDLDGAVEELRHAFPDIRPLAMQRKINSGRGTPAHLL